MKSQNIEVKLNEFTIASETAERLCIQDGDVVGCYDISDNERYLLLGEGQLSMRQAEALAARLLTVVAALKNPSEILV